ncbi:hypothetical protein [Streptomyces jeddahensis]|uniref:Secreted protein n=1 Tax=Streptomyces jeddahensis TaxID=1716141 RepID=A0A177HG88_9ACTN|nr:hypothetical protein [Streptomyces jeddahensis]OAH09941.1 hypothetical protein STSP_67060 [Streptomyces jeddahensis]
MNTGVRITAFAAALAATFGTAYGVGSSVGQISPEPKRPAHNSHAAAPGGDASENHEQGHQAAPPGGLLVSDRGYTLDLKTPSIPAGKPADLQFTVVQEATGRAVTAYKREHDKELHLIVASRDLTIYRHLHPSRAADGTWSTPVNLPKAGSYRLFADFTPRGGDGLTLGTDLAVSGTYAPARTPAPSATAKADGYEVQLHGQLAPGKPSELTLTVTKDGKPVRDLQPYLGAYGHLVALRSGDLAYLHVHPNGEPGDGKTKPGPEVSFTATAPSAGTYRLFLDFKHGGDVHTAAFTVRAEQTKDRPSAPETSSAPTQNETSGHTH